MFAHSLFKFKLYSIIINLHLFGSEQQTKNVNVHCFKNVYSLKVRIIIQNFETQNCEEDVKTEFNPHDIMKLIFVFSSFLFLLWSLFIFQVFKQPSLCFCGCSR